MTQSARDLENTFAHSWTLLLRNVAIVLPGIATGVLSAIAGYLVAGAIVGSESFAGTPSAAALEALDTAARVVAVIVSLAFSLVQMAYVTGMAGAAWRTGRTSLHDGWAALVHRALPMTGAMVLLLLLGICAAVLGPATFKITLLAYAVFVIYTPAAVIIGGRWPIAAIAQSASIALANVLPTLGIVLAVVVVSIAGGLVGALAGRVNEEIGLLVAGLLQQVIVAYASLVVTGEYVKLASAPPPAGS